LRFNDECAGDAGQKAMSGARQKARQKGRSLCLAFGDDFIHNALAYESTLALARRKRANPRAPSGVTYNLTQTEEVFNIFCDFV
jgi:hypothetical protein